MSPRFRLSSRAFFSFSILLYLANMISARGISTTPLELIGGTRPYPSSFSPKWSAYQVRCLSAALASSSRPDRIASIVAPLGSNPRVVRVIEAISGRRPGAMLTTSFIAFSARRRSINGASFFCLLAVSKVFRVLTYSCNAGLFLASASSSIRLALSISSRLPACLAFSRSVLS